MLNGLAGALVTLSALSAWALRPVDAVHGGSYVESATFSTSPFRGAVSSGGGSGIVLFVDGNEAVILTVAHGFDLSAKTGQQAMDEKTYRLASQSTSDGLATPSGSQPIVKRYLGLWRRFIYDDIERCPLANAAGHSGALDDPYGCDGIGPDVDLALMRVELTPAAVAAGLPEVGLSFDFPTPGTPVTLVGFGYQYPCDWSGMSADDRDFFARDALKTAESVIRASFYSEAFTTGLSDVSAADRVAKFGCGAGESVLECAKKRGALPGKDGDVGARWGTGCAGDSGGPWLRQDPGTGAWSVVGLERSSGKVKKSNGEWDMDEDRTYVDGLCVSGEDDKCGSHGDAISTIYPMRSEIKAALAAWNPAWAAKVSYACEPPTAGQAPCGTGCQFCKAGAVGDCVPENVNCATIDALPTFTKETVCGERLSTTTVPRRSCGKPTKADRCRTLSGRGTEQVHRCDVGNADGSCPAIYTCCGKACAAAGPTPSPSPSPSPSPPGAGVSCAVSGRKKKKQCKEKPAGNCVFLKKGKQCLATPQNGGACSSYGKKKLCKRVGGCMWSGSKKKGSCAQV